MRNIAQSEQYDLKWIIMCGISTPEAIRAAEGAYRAALHRQTAGERSIAMPAAIQAFLDVEKSHISNKR